uniref:Uncharacterized protein n=1 Tax=Megaselia scalaris TaxID=36166 RepID=T1H119_MEGSC
MQFKAILQSANVEITQFAQYLLDKEYDIIAATNQSKQKPNTTIAPILLRAQIIKKQLEQKNVIAATLENREAEIKQMKLAAKLKQEELSEMQIRKGLAEKKLSVLQNEHDSKISELERKYEETLELLRKKEKEFEDTMDHLQNDIESLETERSTLKDKLKTINTKRGIVHSESEDQNISTSVPVSAISSSSPHLIEEMNQANEMKNKLRKLEPIFVPKPRDKRIIELEKELAKMKHDWLLGLISINPKKQETLKHIKNGIELKAKVLASEILEEYLNRNPHRAAQSDFSHFPTVEISKEFNLI